MNNATLESSDAPAYRTRMLEAHEHAPDAFTTTAAERRAEAESWWVRRIGSADGLTASFGAWNESQLVGTVALEYSAKPNTRHSMLARGMYAQPAHGGAGLGIALVNAAVAAASSRPEVLSMNLTPTDGNIPAYRLYRSCGLVVWGVQPRALRTEAGLQGNVRMSLLFERPGRAAWPFVQPDGPHSGLPARQPAVFAYPTTTLSSETRPASAAPAEQHRGVWGGFR